MRAKKEGKKHKTRTPRVTTSRDLRKIKRSLSANPHRTSKAIFDHARVTEISKRAQNQILRQMADQRAPTKFPPMSDINCQKQLAWATKYLKTYFHNVLWIDETRATLDGPDGWTKGWLLKGTSPRIQYKRQRGGRRVMIWAGIFGSDIIGPFLVPDGVKMNSVNYCSFLEDNLLLWLSSQNDDIKHNLIVQQDNAPSHAWLSDQESLVND